MSFKTVIHKFGYKRSFLRGTKYAEYTGTKRRIRGNAFLFSRLHTPLITQRTFHLSKCDPLQEKTWKLSLFINISSYKQVKHTHTLTHTVSDTLSLKGMHLLFLFIIHSLAHTHTYVHILSPNTLTHRGGRSCRPPALVSNHAGRIKKRRSDESSSLLVVLQVERSAWCSIFNR